MIRCPHAEIDYTCIFKTSMSLRKRKGSKTSLSLYKTKYFKKLNRPKSSESFNSSQNSTFSEKCPEVKTFNVSSCQTKNNTCIKSTQSQTDNPKLKDTYCQTNGGKVTDCWNNFLDYLSKKGQLSDFKNLAEGLMSGSIDSRNLSWISALHIGQYSICKSTTRMRYDKEYMEFMSLLYLLYGSSVLNVL